VAIENIWWWYFESSSAGTPVTGSFVADLGSPQSTVYAFGSIQTLRWVSNASIHPNFVAQVYVDSYTVNGVPVSGFVPAPGIWAQDVNTITFGWEINPNNDDGDIRFTFQVFGFGKA
jgi:hypothetical protein